MGDCAPARVDDPEIELSAQSELPVLAPELQRANGRARLGLRLRDGRTVLGTLEQHTPCRILFPRVEPEDPFQAVVITTTGGLTGGDRIALTLQAEAGTVATVTTQAAEKIYRSLGPLCRIDVDIRVGDGAWLEWLPQETILFDRSRLRRDSRAMLHPGGRMLACELVLFGRAARGETLDSGHLLDGWHVEVAGGSAWRDAVRLDGDIAALRAEPFGFGQSAGYANVFYAGPDAADHLALARDVAGSAAAADAGATLVNGLLLLRFMDPDASRLRATAGHAICILRQGIGGLPARLPRVWNV